MKNFSNEIKQELIDKLKGLSDTVSGSLSDFSKGKPVFVSEETQHMRMSICRGCPDFNAGTSQCRRCGCFMSAKTKLRQGSCPIGKWGREQ
jgi:hypothetical protein